MTTTEILFAVRRWMSHNPKGPSESDEDYLLRLVEAFYELGRREGAIHDIVPR